MTLDPFVLVHGAWQGAWCWQETITALQSRGKEAFAPELRGLGEDADSESIGLSDHVRDIVRFIIERDMIDVILVGVNYSAALLPMVFEQIPVRVDGIIFLDGLIPLPGESVADVAEIVLPQARQTWSQAAAEAGNRRLPPDDAILDWMLAELPEPQRSAARSRMRPHPFPTLIEPVQYAAFPSAPPYRAYIRCQKTPIQNTGAGMAERAQAHLYPLAAGHLAMLSRPQALADRLLEIVATWNAGDTP